jgi:hypothetical protein
MLGGCVLCPGSTLMVERAAFLEVGPFDTRLKRLEDWDWLMRYLRRHGLATVPEPLAIIHKGGDPSDADVAASTALLRAKHRDDWYRTSWLAGRHFDSTLLVEEAAGAWYAGDRGRLARLLAQALVAYPFRGRAFFAMLARRALRLAAGRGARSGEGAPR